MNIYLKSKDLIWVTKDIFTKSSLVVCKGTILEFTLHGFTFFMLEKVDSFIFLIGLKKHKVLCPPNQISRNFLIAPFPRVSASNISFATFLFATTPVDIHINGRAWWMLFQVFPRYYQRYLYSWGIQVRMFILLEIVIQILLKNCSYICSLKRIYLPLFNNVNICRESSTTSYEWISICFTLLTDGNLARTVSWIS